MRIMKDADERKNEILDAAERIFSQKGFEQTSISDIIETVGVARGTIYYHFKSKESIMDALIERHHVRVLARAEEIAADKSIAVPQRLVMAVMAMKPDQAGTSVMIEHIHKPQNALMHQKVHARMIEDIPPVLAKIAGDGIKEGIFETPYPTESIEMFISYVNTVFDNDMVSTTQQQMLSRMAAFITNLERVFGAKPGVFAGVMYLFDAGETNNG